MSPLTNDSQSPENIACIVIKFVIIPLAEGLTLNFPFGLESLTTIASPNYLDLKSDLGKL